MRSCPFRVAAAFLLMGPLVYGATAEATAGTVLDAVRERGQVICGVDQTPGFSAFDASGVATGFDVDFCRAVAAAVLGRADQIKVRRVNTANKFAALRDGDIDISFGMTTWTFNRDTALGTAFPVVTLYDGQGFLVWNEDGPTTVDGLDGHAICVQGGTTSAANLTDFLKREGLTATVVERATSEEKMNAFATRLCTVVTGDRSELSVQTARRAARPGQWRLLPSTISREPLAPVVAAGDPEWFAVVRWAILATIIAEHRGVTADRLSHMEDSVDGELRRLAGAEPGFGEALGLDARWARRVVAQVGSYAEIFERNLAPLGLERGQNALWTAGGLLYAPPLR